MISSSDLPKLCSNNECQKVMDAPRPGWKCQNDSYVELCNGCFVSYTRGDFCEIYHDKSSGWKHCISCKKRIHHGCVVSEGLYVPSKRRGIKCLDCTPQREILTENSKSRPGTFHRPNIEGTTGNSTCKTAASGSLITQGHVPSPAFGESVNEAERLVNRSTKVSQPLFISKVKNRAPFPSNELATPSPTPPASVPPSAGKVKGTDQEKAAETGELSTPPALVLEYGMGKSSTEAKARNRKARNEHLYVPRLTDHELKEMSRGSNAGVTPLFEKVLTVSDTGKIGRLVLPKKCAEVHFPSIDIPEGEPVIIQDLEGKDWEFNFRYWPNNNSRMYVLEGFNYYVQSMKLQAGDTVMFGKLKPGGKLVMGHRNGTSASLSSKVALFLESKTASPSSTKDKMEKTSPQINNRNSRGKTTSTMLSMFSNEKQNDPDMVTGGSTTKGVPKDKTTSAMVSDVGQENPNDRINVHSDVVGSKSSISAKRKRFVLGKVTPDTSKRVLKTKTVLGLPAMQVNQKKPTDQSNVFVQFVPFRQRKRRQMGLNSSTEHENKMANLAIAFEGGRELIRSRPGSSLPSKIVIEGVKIKSYKDDPVMGRPSMFTMHDQNSVQWAQCEKCYKWRKVPIHVEMPANWTCRQNHWDLLRTRCSAKEELTPDMIKDIYLGINQGSSKKMKSGNLEPEPVGTVEERDAVVVTPVKNVAALPEPPKPNKKHPRHRAGCTCIVCMQAPSGTKHKPSCECCGCATARRRRVLNPCRGKKHSKTAGRKPEKAKGSTSVRKTQKALAQPEHISKPPEIGTSNSNHQMVVNGSFEVDENPRQITLEPDLKPKFDLNLPPEPDEDDMDAVVPVLENPPSGGNI